MNRFSRWMGVVLAGTLALVAGRAGAYSYFLFDGAAVVWPDAQSIRYLSPSTFPPGSEAEAAILTAMGNWNAIPASDFVYFYIPLDQDFPIDNFDGFNDTMAVPAEQLDPGVLAVTTLVNDGAAWFDIDVLFSDNGAGAGYNFDPNPSCDVITLPTEGYGYSFPLVGVHEMGHAIGLGHDPIGDEAPGTSWFASTMNPRYPSGGPIGQENIIELHTDDRTGGRFLYPHSGPSDPPWIDLALPEYSRGTIMGKAAPLGVDPTTALPGQEVVLRSVIENLGTTSEFSVRQGFYMSVDDIIDVNDTFLGSLTWDLVFEDALEFDVVVTLPQDPPAGDYWLGAIIDDANDVLEVFEDNNAALYCDVLTVEQLQPVLDPFDVQLLPCGLLFVSVPPVVSHPLNMAPIVWSLDNPEPGMTIDTGTGIVRWPSPVPSTFLYALRVRATNGAGSAMETMLLGVEPLPPQIGSMADRTATCFDEFIAALPQLTSPGCMEPILNWSLDAAPPGMTIDHGTGRVRWTGPISSEEIYNITLRATNAAGNGTVSWSLNVVPGDLSGDGSVNLLDLTIMETCLGGPGTAVAGNCACIDIDGNSTVDLRDVAWFLIHFDP